MPAFFCSAFTEARVLVSSLLAAVMVIGPAQGDAPPSGANLFKTNCARCHGNNGEGTKRYPKRLEGDRSVAQLADLIRKTMPEDAPGTLSDPEASSLAQFVFDGFYSPLARERL
ncbi:MAG: c-type cytochrome [Gemmataceae bacterium]